MTLVTAALDRVARECSVQAVSDWITATTDDAVKIRDDFLPQTVDDILERVDLPSPIGAETTITGDGSETYSLPSTLKRLKMGRQAVYDATNNRWCIPARSESVYAQIKDLGSSDQARYYKLTGYEGNWSISFVPSPSVAITVHYQSVNWMADSGGTPGSAFAATTDVLLLPRELVEAGIVWRFREQSGFDFQGKHAEYERKLAELAGDRKDPRKPYGAPEVRWQNAG